MHSADCTDSDLVFNAETLYYEGQISDDECKRNITEKAVSFLENELLNMTFPCNDKDHQGILDEIVEELCKRDSEDDTGLDGSDGSITMSDVEKVLGEYDFVDSEMFDIMVSDGCTTMADMCSLIQPDPVNWLEISDQNKLDIFIRNLRWITIQNQCGGTHANEFSLNNYVTNAPGWSSTGHNSFTGEACTATSNFDQVTISFQGGGSCNDCVTATPCPMNISDGVARIKFVPCTADGCGLTFECISISIDATQSSDFFDHFFDHCN